MTEKNEDISFSKQNTKFFVAIAKQKIHSLYYAGLLKNNSIQSVLHSIANWRTNNMGIISKLRGQSFFGKLFVSKSSTLKMAEDLEKNISSMRI